ncbi:MAG TPA: hypothetical protein VEK07_19075 [Polyangiaceae bacterium]|nr:hypothetical protein [Polyangiaceae bacterium]
MISENGSRGPTTFHADPDDLSSPKRALPRLALAFALLSSLAVGARPARAQAENQAAARALFDDARALMKAGNFAAACPKLEGAIHLYSSVGIALNLGDCYEKIGYTASAWTEFGEAASLANRADRSDDAAEARRRQSALEGKLTRLVVHVPRDIPGLSVRRDGADLPAAAWDSPIPVDPGSHEIRAEAPGHGAWSRSVTVAGSGQTTTVEVPPLAPAPSANPPPTAPPLPASPASSAPAPMNAGGEQARGSPGGRAAGWVLVGSGVAIGVAGGVLMGVASGDASNARTNQDKPEYQSAQTLWTAGLVGAIAGGAAAAVGVVLLLTSRGEEHGVSLKVSPWLSSGASGGRVAVTW